MILLLGAAGQLGQELTALAARRQVPLRGLRHAELDIADQPAVSAAIRAERPAVVVNAAAYTKVDQAEADAPAAYRANADGAGALAAACAAEGVPLVHISTDYMFDGSKPGAYVETDPIAPLGVYGASKAAGEAAVRRAAGRHLILRTSWVYGPYGNNFLKTMLRLAGERDELRIVADQRGCPTATADLAEAILHLLPGVAADGFPWGTYHCAGTGVTTWCDFAAEIVGAQAPVTQRNPRVTPIATADYPTPARRPANSELDSSRFHAAFGYRPPPWRERVRQVVADLMAPVSVAPDSMTTARRR